MEANMTKLSCKFIYHDWHQNPKKYTCFITKASITKPNIEIEAVDGVHKNYMTNDEVEGILFEDSNVAYFPKGFDKIFPRLKHFSIDGCGLKKMFNSDLIGLEGLLTLAIYSCPLVTLPSNLLANMTNLERIVFQNCKLERISSKLLKPLLKNDLQVVRFCENTKINAFFRLDQIGVGSVASVQKLMEVIDASCEKPIEDSGRQSAAKNYTYGFESMWKSGKFSDFAITVESKEFRVHKLVLAVQSRRFYEMFEDVYDIQSMKIRDISASAVEEFLHFLYTGKLLTSGETNVLELFQLSSKMKVPALKSICEQMILENLNDSNAFKIFSLGHSYNSDDLKSAAFKEIKEVFRDNNIDESLMNHPDNLKELLEAKNTYEAIIKKFAKI